MVVQHRAPNCDNAIVLHAKTAVRCGLNHHANTVNNLLVGNQEKSPFAQKIAVNTTQSRRWRYLYSHLYKSWRAAGHLQKFP